MVYQVYDARVNEVFFFLEKDFCCNLQNIEITSIVSSFCKIFLQRLAATTAIMLNCNSFGISFTFVKNVNVTAISFICKT